MGKRTKLVIAILVGVAVFAVCVTLLPITVAGQLANFGVNLVSGFLLTLWVMNP